MTAPAPDYPAAYEVSPIDEPAARVRPPGSKSLTNRALLIAGLADGVSRLEGPLHSDDTALMVGCLTALGVTITPDDDDLVVEGSGRLEATGQPLDVGSSGTTARFISAAAALADGLTQIDGSPRMRERPIGDLVDALRELGVDVRYEGVDGFPPLTVGGSALEGGPIEIDASRSSQFVSALMMISPFADRAVDLLLGGPVVSRPYIDNTIEVMRHFGTHSAWIGPSAIRVEPGSYRPATYVVEADASAAVYGWAAAAITGGTVTVEALARTTSQADVGALDILEAMGCVVTGDREVTVRGPARLGGVDVDMNHCPDAVLGLAVVAAFAEAPSTFRNIANLRIKETDRLAALETELRRLGVGATTGPDWLRIEPGPMSGATIHTYNDHRMAMSFAIAGLRIRGVVISDPGSVAKTWPGFFEMLESL